MRNIKDLQSAEAILVSKHEWEDFANALSDKATWCSGIELTNKSPWDGRSSTDAIYLYLGDRYKEKVRVCYGRLGKWDGEHKIGVNPFYVYPASDFYEPKYKVGKQYEFKAIGHDWVRGTLLAIVDHQVKYVASLGEFNSGTFEYIREIPLQKVVKWVNMRPDGEVVSICDTKEEAEKLATDIADNHDLIQVKLEGTIKF